MTTQILVVDNMQHPNETHLRGRNKSCGSNGKHLLLLPFLMLGHLDGIAYQTTTHSAISYVACHDHPESKVQSFLVDKLGYTDGLEERGYIEGGAGSMSLLEALQRGSVDEDSNFVVRYSNHFYDPFNKAGLSDAIGSIFFTDALNWAWNNKGEVLNEDYGWKHTREVYFKSLVATMDPGGDFVEDHRKNLLAETFVGLGHCLHLLEDMAQPQHTRNDAHMPPEYGGQGAPYEDFCDRNYGNPTQVAGLPFIRGPRFDLSLMPSQINGMPREFVAFWDTFQYVSAPDADPADPAGLNKATLGLAEFSHCYFVTDDTMFTGDGLDDFVYLRSPVSGKNYELEFLNDIPEKPVEAKHEFPYPSIHQLSGLAAVLDRDNIAESDSIFVWRLGELYEDSGHLNVPDVLLSLAPGDLGPCCVVNHSFDCFGNLCNNLELGIDDNVRATTAHVLIPKAVAYSARLLNYFFRGRLNIAFASTSPGSGLVEVTNDSDDVFETGTGDSLGEGTFYVQEITGGDSKATFAVRQLATVNSSTLYSGTLAKGSKVTIPVSGIQQGRDLRIVFKGTLGNEQDIAVAVGRYCGVPQVDTSARRYTLLDLGPIPGIFDNDRNNWALNRRGQILGFHQPFAGLPIPSGGGGYVWTGTNVNGTFTFLRQDFVGSNQSQYGCRVMDINDAGVVAGIAFEEDPEYAGSGKMVLAKWKPLPNGEYQLPEISRNGVGGLIINNASDILDPLAGIYWPDKGPAVKLSEQFTNEVGSQADSLITTLSLDDRGRFLSTVQQGTNGNFFVIWAPHAGIKDTGIKAGPLGLLNNSGLAALLTFKSKFINGIEIQVPNLVIWDEYSGRTSDLDTSLSFFDLNDCGQLVGYLNQLTASGIQTTPFIWDSQTGLRNLRLLVNMPNGISLTHALNINCDGFILGAGFTGNERHAYLLTPPANASISAQPRDFTIQSLGQAAAFTLLPSGSGPFSYQWYFNGDSIAGATNASLIIPHAYSTNAGAYFAVVENSLGRATSSVASLTMSPVITQPKMSVSVSGTQLTISWPGNFTGFKLESTDSLTQPSWTTVGTSNPTVINFDRGKKFYRLRK